MITIIQSGRFGLSSLSDLSPVLWLDASDASTLTLAGSAVSQWSNKGSLGGYVSQGVTTSKPTSGIHSQNGKNVLYFDGGDDLSSNLASSSWKFLHDGTSQYIALAVASVTSTTPSGQSLVATKTSAAGIGCELRRLVNTVDHSIGNGTGSGVVGNYISNTSTSMILMQWFGDPGNATVASRSVMSVNSGSNISINTFSATPSTANPAMTLRIGSRTSLYWQGDVAEIVIINGTKASLENMVLARNYLNNKWAVY